MLTAQAAAEPSLVHYFPIVTTLISAAFIAVLIQRAANRSWAPHLVWWAAGVFFYGLGTAIESMITLTGNTLLLNRLWYWAGAILGAYPLATGSLYLIGRRKLAHTLTAISLAYVLFASYMVWTVPLDAAQLEAHRPSGDVITVGWVRKLSIPINSYAALFLIGGAIYSSSKFFLAGDKPKRAVGTAFIAVGAILPGIGGGMARAGYVEWLYVGELAGMILIWIGYEFCIRSPGPVAQPSSSSSGGSSSPS